MTSREPTEAETRAEAAAFAELCRQEEASLFTDGEEIGPQTLERLEFEGYPNTILVEGQIDLMALTRAVIRSLREATPPMIKAAVSRRTYSCIDGVDVTFCPDIDDEFRDMIDCASPEITPAKEQQL